MVDEEVNEQEKEQELAGVIDLHFVRRGDRTIADTAYHRGNSRVSSRMISHSSEVPYHILVVSGGGLVEGEKYRYDIKLDPETHAILSTQAPTPVYKCERGLLTTHDTFIILEAGSFLEYYMDELIPYKNAYYHQFTDIDMAPDATLVLSDGITGGWSPEDKPFLYTEMGMRTRISMDGNLLFNDYLLCTPESDSMYELGMFEGYTNFNSCVIIDPGLEGHLGEFIDAARKVIDGGEDEARFGITALEGNGAVFRVLSRTGQINRRIVWQFINFWRVNCKGLEPLDLRKNDR